MPYKDPERRKQASVAWRREQISKGYGKALYARRKARLDNEYRLRESLESALDALHKLENAIHDGKPVDIDKRLNILKEIIELGLNEAPNITGKPLDFMPKQ